MQLIKKPGFSIIFLIGILCSAQIETKAQQLPLYGFTNVGERYGDGGFFELKNGIVTSIPFRREVCFPYNNFISANGKVYGLAMVSSVGSFQAIERCIFEAENPVSPLKGVYQGLQPYKAVSTDGFCITGDSLFLRTGPGLVMMNLTSSKIDTLVSYELSINQPLTPLYHSGKVYHCQRISGGYCFMEYDLLTKVNRVLTTIQGSVLSFKPGVNQILENGYLYFTSQESQTGKLYKINLSDTIKSLVHTFGANTDVRTFGRYDALGGWYYNSCNTGGVNGQGYLFRFNPSSGQIEVIKDFGTDFGKPIYGVVSFQEKIYGIVSNKNGTNDAAVYEYNPTSSSYRLVAEFPNVNGLSFHVTGLLVHNNELYVYGARGGSKTNGAVHKLNVSTGTYESNEPFVFKNFGSGYAKPVFTNNKFYNVSDTIFYSYDPVTRTIQEELGMTGYEVMGGEWPGLTVYNGLIYGSLLLGNPGENSMIIYSYNPVNQNFQPLKEVSSSHFGQWDEMVIKNNQLYLFGGFDSIILKLNLLTLDTTLIPLFPGYGIPNTKFSVIEDNIYFTTYPAESHKSALFRLNILNDQLEIHDESTQIPDTIGMNMVVIAGKFYGVAMVNSWESGYLFSYDPVAKTLEKLTNQGTDALKYYGNLNATGSMIHGSLIKHDTSTNSDVFSIFTYDVENKELEIYPIKSAIGIAGIPYFVVSTLSGQNGIEEKLNQKTTQISLFPNPANKEVNLKFETPFSGIVEVFDLLGHQVMTQKISSTEKKVSIETQDLVGGIYLVKCKTTSGKKLTTQCLLVNH